MKKTQLLFRLIFFALLLPFSAFAAPELQVVVSGLREPLYLTHAGDGSGRMYVVEKAGYIKVISGGKLHSANFLDISKHVSRGGEQGLLGLAFSPKFKTDPRIFVNYTDTEGDTVISQFSVSAGFAQPESEVPLLKINQPYANHNGGCLQFGPDGMLYIATGDGGSGGDPRGNGQSLNTLLGKILRVDVSTSGKILIPLDNPFSLSARNDLRKEIWAYGLRNPWRFSFDAETKRLFAGDVGQNRFEEIDIIEKGKNYGWNLMEASHSFKDNCNKQGLELPIAEHGRDKGISVTGGYVYRGKRIPELFGAYLFADFGSGTIWKLVEEEGTWKKTELLKTKIPISSFGEDEDKELYVLDFSGRVLSFVNR